MPRVENHSKRFHLYDSTADIEWALRMTIEKRLVWARYGKGWRAAYFHSSGEDSLVRFYLRDGYLYEYRPDIFRPNIQHLRPYNPAPVALLAPLYEFLLFSNEQA